MCHLQETYSIVFYTKIENFSGSGEGRRAQAEGLSVKGSSSRVGHLALRLREGAHYFQEGPTYYSGGGGGGR